MSDLFVSNSTSHVSRNNNNTNYYSERLEGTELNNEQQKVVKGIEKLRKYSENFIEKKDSTIELLEQKSLLKMRLNVFEEYQKGDSSFWNLFFSGLSTWKLICVIIFRQASSLDENILDHKTDIENSKKQMGEEVEKMKEIKDLIGETAGAVLGDLDGMFTTDGQEVEGRPDYVPLMDDNLSSLSEKEESLEEISEKMSDFVDDLHDVCEEDEIFWRMNENPTENQRTVARLKNQMREKLMVLIHISGQSLPSLETVSGIQC